jgi:glycine cleavage system H lipoate-binding protein
VPAGHFFHQGHAWARVEEGGTVRIGIDDFAQRLLGRPGALRLPGVGSRLEQGAEGWSFLVGSRPIGLLSPVGGEVVAVNENVLGSPGLVNDDPYGAGWLLTIRVPELKRNLRNLMSGDLAVGWMEQAEERLRRRIGGEGQTIMQDGGFPVEGIVLSLGDDAWEKIAAEFLGTE